MEGIAANRIVWPEGPFDLDPRAAARSGPLLTAILGWVLTVSGLGLAVATEGFPQQLPAKWEPATSLGLARPVLPALFACLAGIGVLLVLLARRRGLTARLALRGRIVEVDLLRRRMLRRRGAVWEFAYDWQGKRIYGRTTVYRDPLILDGTVTRGAALVMDGVMGGGRHLLLQSELAPLRLPPDRAARLSSIIAAHFNAERPRAGSTPALLAAAEPRDWAKRFVAAQTDAWNAPDVPQVNAAIERRHAAAWQAGRRDVDALLQRVRAALPRERPSHG